MKRGIFAALALGVVFGVTFTLTLGSYQPHNYRIPRGYIHLRPGGVASDDTPLTNSTSTWYDVNDWVRIPEDWGSVSISIYAYGDGTGAGDPNAGVFDANLYVVHEYGAPMHICSLSGTIGELELSHDPVRGWGGNYRSGLGADPNHKWAEGPITLNDESWRYPVGLSGEANGVGEINFNPAGATHINILFEKTGISTLYAVMTGRP